MGQSHSTSKTTMNSQVSLVLSLLAGVCISMPQRGPQGQRNAAPSVAERRVDTEDLSPKPYGYQYGVDDAETKASFQKSESRDNQGRVLGSFVIALPDGRIQTTKYTADPIQGFIAEVSYEGQAVYPPVLPGQLSPKAIAPYVPVGYLG